MPPKQYNQVFLDSYSNIFPSIVKSRKGANFAFCTVCSVDIKIAHGGSSDIKNHLRSKKHGDLVKTQEKISKIGTFFGTDENDVINAECFFTSFILEHNLPIAVADHVGPLLRKMFPKCDAVKKYGSGRTKTTAIIRKMAIEKKDSLVNILQNTVFAISTDGSNDSDSQLYPIVVTYFDHVEGKIENSLLAVPVLSGTSTGQNIGNLLLETLQSRAIPMKNCIALSADNAYVMVGLKNGVAAILKRENEEILVLGCSCHLIHLAAEKGAKSLPVKVDEILIDIFYYLQRSGKRKEELKQLQSLYDVDNYKILKHVCTRWLSLGRSLKRLIENWIPLTSFFKNQIKQVNRNDKNSALESYRIPLKVTKKDYDDAFRKNEPPGNMGSSKKRLPVLSDERPSKKVKKDANIFLHKSGKLSKSETAYDKLSQSETASCSLTREERIFMFLSSDIHKAYCLFLDFIIPTFEKTNVILQSAEPKIHVLNSLLLDMFRELVTKFVNPSAIKCCSSLIDINYADKSKQKNDDDLVIGTAAFKMVNTLKDEDKVFFYSAIRKYYATSCDYIRHKFPINSDVLKHAEVADLSKISRKSFSDIDFFLNKFPMMLPQKENETPDEARDKLQSEFCSLQIDELPEEVNKEERIDRKWAILGKVASADGALKYNKLSNVMSGILTIPHSNSECERVFSSVKKTRTQFRSSLLNEQLEDILIAKNMQKGHCYEQKFDKDFLSKAKSATYEYLNSNKK